MRVLTSSASSRIWDTSTGQCLRTLVHEDNPAVTSVCFSPNGRFVLAFNLDNCIRLWDYVAGSVKKTYQGHKNEKFAIGGCFGVLDGVAFVASASETGEIVLWDVKSKEVLQQVPGHKGVCFWVDIHKDIMASAGQDHTIRVYRHVGDTEVVPNGTLTAEEQTNGHLLSTETPIRQEDIKMEDA
jgi:COMPASS component SWD3